MKLGDERLRFYLENRAEIEEWAALGKEVAAWLDEWLRGLEGRAREACAEWAEDFELTVPNLREQAYPSFRLQRRSWKAGGEEPVVSLALEWVRRKTFLTDKAAPYVGINVNVRHTGGEAFHARLAQRAKPTRQKRRDLVSEWWAAYRYVPAGEKFWDDLDAYATVLIRELGVMWSAYGADVEWALAQGDG